MTSPSDLEALIERLCTDPTVAIIAGRDVVVSVMTITQMLVERREAADALSAALRVTEPIAVTWEKERKSIREGMLPDEGFVYVRRREVYGVAKR